MLDSQGLEHDLETRGARRGRKPAGESRAAEIRARLAAWKQTPKRGRISLRALAAELGTSHQLLSSYLRGWDKWQMKEYGRKARAIRGRAKAEGRPMTRWEESQALAHESASFHAMLDSVWVNVLMDLKAAAKAGRLTMGEIKMLNVSAQRGDLQAQKILQMYAESANDPFDQNGMKKGQNNLPPKSSVAS